MTYVRKIFGSGQVTLPKSWRKKINTSVVQIQISDDKLIITPIAEEEYETIFDSKAFGYPNGIPVQNFLDTLKKVNHGSN